MPINMSIEYPELQAENTELRMINDSLLEALKELLDVCPCQNGCKENDMTCATQKAKAAIKKAEQ